MDKKEEEEEEVDDDELIVGECFEVGEEAAEKGTFSDECKDEDEVDMEEASDVANLGKLYKKWEKYPIGHKLER